MKNWKQFTFMAIIAIVGIIIGFMACNNDNETTHVHQWGDWTVTTAPTCTTEGVETKVCTLDATHKETRPIAIDPNAHLWGNWIETTPITITADGEETKTCAHNSEHKQTRPIEHLTTQDFTIGTVSFIFVYAKLDTTSWAKLNAIIQTYADYMVTNPSSSEVERIRDLASHTEANYRIIVNYSDEGKSAGFIATDFQTLTVGSDYLANTTLTRAIIRNAFVSLYEKPYP